MLRALVAIACLAGLFACPAPGPPVDAGSSESIDAGDPAADDDAGVGCLAPPAVDHGRADAGRAFLFSGPVGGRLVPRLAFDNLWVVWGTPKPADVPAALRERYGFTRALTDNDGLPMGFRADGAFVRADCLVCHAGEVLGQPVVGAANHRLDLELFIEDLQALATLSGTTAPSPPRVRTGARGVTDIIGMTLQLGLRQRPAPFPVNTEIGFQDPQAWWTLATRTRVYADGSGPQSAHRTMMATQLAFGVTQAELEALEPQYVALREYLLTLTAPPWPFAPPPKEAVARGRALYRQTCARCHGDDRCQQVESREISLAEVGTDGERSTKYRQNEVALINATWFGADQPHRVAGGYLAPPLKGVWASAPYLHNGSVPTLEGVLSLRKRPAVFRVLGTARADYDEQAVGLRVEVLPAAPMQPPRAQRAAVYDSTRPGLGNSGHRFGDELTDAQRSDLLQFLKTL